MGSMLAGVHVDEMKIEEATMFVSIPPPTYV
jgi:hypothetical protein